MFKSDDTPALIDGDTGQTITYKQLQDTLIHFPIQQRCLLFLFNENRLTDLLTYLGAIHSGCVVALLDGHMSDAFKQQLIEHYSPDVIYSHQPLRKDYKFEAPNIYRSMKNGPPLHPQLQLLLSTSGTTGNPKLIRLSKENWVSNAKSIVEYLGITPQDRAIITLPFHYSYGLSVIHSHLLAGASCVLTQSSVAQQPFWDIFNRYACTSLAGVPYTYKMLERVGFLKMHLPSLTTLTQAGGRLDPTTICKFQQKVKRFFVMYGQTEATARISYLPPVYLPEKAASIGIPIPDGHLEIVKGELVYTGPNVMLGYAENRDDLAKGDELKGVLPTGDFGYQDEMGLFYISGRIKRISKIYGLRINLDDIEKAIVPFGNGAVTATDERLFIYLENSSHANCEKCIQYLSEMYELHPSAFRCVSIPSLPKTSSGKIDYPRLLS